MGPPPGASPPMRMTASWSGSNHPTAYKSVARRCAPMASSPRIPQQTDRQPPTRPPKLCKKPCRSSSSRRVLGLTQREYCERHGLSLKSFGNWRGQLKREDVAGGDARWGRHPRLRHMVSPMATPMANETTDRVPAVVTERAPTSIQRKRTSDSLSRRPGTRPVAVGGGTRSIPILDPARRAPH